MYKTLTTTLALVAGLTTITAAQASSPVKKNGTSFKQLRVKSFSAISVTGGLNVILQYHPDRPPSVQEAGRGINSIRVSVNKKTLNINAPSGKLRSQLPQVVISLSQPLRSLSVQGIADVHGHDLRAKQLNVWAKGPGHIALSGRLNTSQVWQTGGGYVSLKGVQAKDLSVKLSELATTKLQGKAQLLTARLTNSSTLQAERLRATNIFVQTANNAVARVFPVKNLRAFARGRSQIFYYHSPKHITEDARQSGNILQMGWKR